MTYATPPRHIGALCLLLLACLTLPTAQAESEPERVHASVAVLPWGLTQTLLALGVVPAAAADAAGYREWVASPPLPEEAVNIGRRSEPHFASLRAVKPKRILVSAFYTRHEARLGGIAPVETRTIFEPDGDPLANAFRVAETLADTYGRPQALAAMRQRFEDAVASLRQAADGEPRSVYILQFSDADHVRVFGETSLFQGVLEGAGLVNAWQHPSNFWGFSSAEIIRLDQAADYIVVIEPVPWDANQMMKTSPVWRALPVVAQGRVIRMDPVWTYGGVPSATRFAALLAEAIRD